MASKNVILADWPAVLMTLIGVAVLVFGARTFYVQGHFGLADILRCGLLLIPAALFLLVTSYVVQHARLAAVVPLVAGAAFVAGSPSFAVALGLALIIAIVGPALDECRHSTAR